MYYLLNDRFSLRGWEKLPYALVDSEAHRASFLSGKTFETLNLCNGKIDFSLPMIGEERRKIARELVEQGIVSPSAPGKTIAEHQKYRCYPNRFMESAHWSITGCCNCQCRHCYINGAENRYGEISHEDAMKIARGLVDAGVLQCSITGGEALVREDFWEILDCLLEGGIYISTIYSNGFLVNDQVLDRMEERGIHPEFNMSFDGIGYHDWLRGMNGAEEAVRRAFELCQKRGFPTGAEMCIWKDNYHTLRDSINYLASVGCRGIKLNPIGNTGAWLEGGYQEKHGLSVEETFRVYYDYLDDFYRDLPRISVNLGGFFMGHGSEPDLYRIPAIQMTDDPSHICMCAHARTSMYISAEGRAMTCMPLANFDDFQKDYPKIQEIGVQACLSDSKYMELVNIRASEVLEHNDKCRECPYKNVCLGGCRAAAMLVYGDVLAPDDTICSIFRDGWTKKIVEKVKRLRPEAECLELKQMKNTSRLGKGVDDR